MLANFHTVDEQVSRSARPGPEDYAYVKLHFASVLDLEGEDADIAEANELAPLRVLAGDISDWEIYSPLLGFTVGKLESLLEALETAPKPCLIHCQFGRDRTGIVVAAYRVRHCGWTKDAAMKEARALGFRWYINVSLDLVWRKFQ